MMSFKLKQSSPSVASDGDGITYSSIKQSLQRLVTGNVCQAL